ncbi:MAG: hypothetical protein ACOH15_00775 [Acetobacterium sp.]
MTGVASILLPKQESLNRSELLAAKTSYTIGVIIGNAVDSFHDNQRSTTKDMRYKKTMRKKNTYQLLVEYEKNRDSELKKLLIESHLYIPEILSIKYGSINGDNRSVFMVACLGLNSALDYFDINSEYDFETFAVATIIRELLAFIGFVSS